MQILIVITLSNDTHRQCSWATDRVSLRDKQGIARFVQEVYRDAGQDDAHILEVHIFAGGSVTHHVEWNDIQALTEV